MKTITFFILLGLSFQLAAQKAPLKVTVTDYDKIALEGEKVIFINQSSKAEIIGISDKNGVFKINLPVGVYDIKLKSVGDAQDYSSLEIPPLPPNSNYQEMWMEVMISQPKSFTLDNLQFASGQSTILKSSYNELNELLEYLSLKPNLNIEIAGHTDSDGEEEANRVLSQKRANAVKAYLVKNGISSARLNAKGYGETTPIADNSTSQGKAKNRRTEVKML